MKIPKAIVNNPMDVARRGAAGADISALVGARETAARTARNRSDFARLDRRAKATKKVALRKDRVSIERSDVGGLRVSIAPKFLSDMLKEQLGLGFAFAFINPGVFIMVGIAALLNELGVSAGLAFAATVGIWSVLLTSANVVYALCARRRLRLEIPHNGYYALYARSSKRPILFGQVSALQFDIDEPKAHRLGRARFEDQHGRVDVDRLTPRDLDTLRRVLLQ